jgi:hypothetical protein
MTGDPHGIGAHSPLHLLLGVSACHFPVIIVCDNAKSHCQTSVPKQRQKQDCRWESDAPLILDMHHGNERRHHRRQPTERYLLQASPKRPTRRASCSLYDEDSEEDETQSTVPVCHQFFWDVHNNKKDGPPTQPIRFVGATEHTYLEDDSTAPLRSILADCLVTLGWR